MPSYTRGIKRDVIAFVQLGATAAIYYGFSQKDFSKVTGAADVDFTVLGQIIDPPTGAIKMLRASTPKPARVKRVIDNNPGVAKQGSISTFCATPNIATALAAGWKLISGVKSTSISQTARTTTALAELSDGSFYAFPMNTADFEAYKEKLGLKAPKDLNITTEAERLAVIRGSSFPRPGKASKILDTGAEISSFYATEAENIARADGWSILSSEVVL